MSVKKESRLRRARRARFKMRELGVNRLCVNRTPNHIYAQIIDDDGGSTLVSASSLAEKSLEKGGNTEASVQVGRTLARQAGDVGIRQGSLTWKHSSPLKRCILMIWDEKYGEHLTS